MSIISSLVCNATYATFSWKKNQKQLVINGIQYAEYIIEPYDLKIVVNLFSADHNFTGSKVEWNGWLSKVKSNIQ